MFAHIVKTHNFVPEKAILCAQSYNKALIFDKNQPLKARIPRAYQLESIFN